MIIKTDEKKKSATQKNKAQDKKKGRNNGLRKDYRDMQPCRAQTLEFPISKMTYGFVKSHELKYIITTEGRLDFKEGWIECILYMMYTMVKFYPDTYEELFRINNITCSDLLLDKTYGTVKLDGKKQRRVFKLYDTGLYVESRFEAPEVFNAVAGLIKLYSGDYANVLLSIEDRTLTSRAIETDKLDSKSEVKTLDNVFDAVSNGCVITEIEIHNEKLPISTLDGLLYIFCKWTSDNFGDEGVKKLPKNKYVGVVKDISRDDVDYNSLNGTDYYVYTNHDNRDIINFVRKSVEVLKLDKNTIKFKVQKYGKAGN